MRNKYIKTLAMAALSAAPIALFLLLPMGTWADFASLPGHPLIVHSVVVLLPVVSVWAIVAACRTDVFNKTFRILYGLALVSSLGVIAAKSSGDSLAAAVGLPRDHAEAGNNLVAVSIALVGSIFLIAAAKQLFSHQGIHLALRIVAGAIAVAALPLTYIAGHTGAESVWEEDYARAQEPISRENISLSRAEVARRGSAEECWTIVDGSVYDMTTFIQRHPAGSGDIIDMCGKDASDAFLGEHEGQGEPEKWLATLKIGVLKD